MSPRTASSPGVTRTSESLTRPGRMRCPGRASHCDGHGTRSLSVSLPFQFHLAALPGLARWQEGPFSARCASTRHQLRPLLRMLLPGAQSAAFPWRQSLSVMVACWDYDSTASAYNRVVIGRTQHCTGRHIKQLLGYARDDKGGGFASDCGASWHGSTAASLLS